MQHRTVRPDVGTLTSTITLTKVSRSGGMVIEHFDFELRDRAGLVYEGDTYFGFFSKEALTNQVGLADARLHAPAEAELRRAGVFPYPHDPPYPEDMDRARLMIKDACDANGVKFLSSWNDPNKSHEENVQTLLDWGVAIISGGGEEKAQAGRKMTNRQMPVG